MTYTAEIWQGGMRVAKVETEDEAQCQSEAMHYAIQYAEDGPVEVKFSHPPNELAAMMGRMKGSR